MADSEIEKKHNEIFNMANNLFGDTIIEMVKKADNRVGHLEILNGIHSAIAWQLGAIAYILEDVSDPVGRKNIQANRITMMKLGAEHSKLTKNIPNECAWCGALSIGWHSVVDNLPACAIHMYTTEDPSGK